MKIKTKEKTFKQTVKYFITEINGRIIISFEDYNDEESKKLTKIAKLATRYLNVKDPNKSMKLIYLFTNGDDDYCLFAFDDTRDLNSSLELSQITPEIIKGFEEALYEDEVLDGSSIRAIDMRFSQEEEYIDIDMEHNGGNIVDRVLELDIEYPNCHKSRFSKRIRFADKSPNAQSALEIFKRYVKTQEEKTKGDNDEK